MDMSLGNRLHKEHCQGCNKNILKHQKFGVCSGCNDIAHDKCALKLFEFDHILEKWTCWKCSENQTMRYNPFNNLYYDKHLPDDTESMDEVNVISEILNSCKSYNIEQFNELMKHQGPNLAVLFNNIDGASTNFDTFSADLSLIKTKFAAVCLAETNLEEEHGKLYDLPGYIPILQSKLPGKSKGSGLGIFLNDQFTYSPCITQNQCTKNLESFFIKINNLEKTVTIGVVYRPPSAESLTKSVNELEKILESLPKDDVFITGDFNVDLLDKNSPAMKKFEELIFSHAYAPSISIATHFKPNCNPSCLDNILIQNPENLLASGVLNPFVSHHAPVFCISNIKLTKEQELDPKNLPKYDYSNNNLAKFVSKLEDKITCPDTFSLDEVGFNKFNDIVKTTMEECFTVTPSSIMSRRNRLINPWITSGIIESIREKILLYEKWKKSITNDNITGNTDLYTAYSDFRKILKHTIKQAKKLHMYKKFQTVQGDCKKTWRLINEIRGKQNKSIKSYFVINGDIVEDRRKIANEFNNYFISIAANLNDQTNEGVMIDPLPKFSEYLDKSVCSSMFLDNCTVDEISEIINDLSVNKSSDIPVRVLKSCSHVISQHLTIFFNFFIDNSIFPDILKVGQVTPIFKKGDSQLLENYRPVSLLPIFGKLLEKILYKRLSSYLTAKNILHKSQFGFRKHHSTAHAINHSINIISNGIEKKQHVLGIFIDLSKAFDTINHKFLLTKLSNYGIRGKCLQLIDSYLTSRKQTTNFNSEKSDIGTIIYGVPQGSVLGPLLFLIYINDIINSSKIGQFVLFADDTNIFIAADSEAEAYSMANITLCNVQQYMISNQLHINLSKCMYIHFRPKVNNKERLTCARAKTHKYHTQFSLKIGGTKLKKVDKAKFLGVIIDENLTWDDHIKYLETKLLTCIATIKRIRKFIPKTYHTQLYHSLFLPHLTYGISSWGGACPSKLAKIFNLQKRCVRILFGNTVSFDHAEYYETCARARPFICKENYVKDFELENTKPLFNNNQLLTIHNLYKLQLITETFKIKKFNSPVPLDGSLTVNISSKRHILLNIPRCSLMISMNNYHFKSTTIWNKLIPDILETPELDSVYKLIIPGSAKNSDLSSSIGYIKHKTKAILIDIQSLGKPSQWLPDNTNFTLERYYETKSK